MTGLIDVGGGMRDIYGAGVMDCFLDNNINFDICIGVSAGSANLSSFLAKQRGRNYRFYTEYALRKEYMSFENYTKNGSYINLDYIYSTLSNNGCEDPLDFETLSHTSSKLIIVATEAETGEAKYFGNEDFIKDNFWLMKASCAIPVVCRPYEWNNTKYFDGGVADPIPVEKAFEIGCDRVVVIIPRPVAEKKREFSTLMKPFLRNYPATLAKLEERQSIYNRKLRLMKKYENDGKLILISPDSDKGLNMLTKNKDKLIEYYNKAYEDTSLIIEKLR